MRDTGLLHAISVNQGLEIELLKVRNELSQQNDFNNQLQAELQAGKLEIKRVESEAEAVLAAKKVRVDTVTVRQYLDLKEDQEQRRKVQRKSHTVSQLPAPWWFETP